MHSHRSDVSFSSGWEQILIDAKNSDINEPSLPPKRKRPARLLNETKTNAYGNIEVVKTFMTVHT